MTAFLVSHFPFTSYYGRKKIIFPLCRDREEGKGKVTDKTPAKKATVEAWPQTGKKTMDSHKVVSRDGIQDSTGTKRAAGTFPLPSPRWRSSDNRHCSHPVCSHATQMVTGVLHTHQPALWDTHLYPRLPGVGNDSSALRRKAGGSTRVVSHPSRSSKGVASRA